MKLASQFTVFGRKDATAEDWMAEQYLAAKRAEEKLMAEQRLAAKRALQEKKAAGCSADLFVAKSAEEDIDAELSVAKRPKVAVKEAVAAEVDEPKAAAGAVKKKKVMERVHQEYIDALLKRYPPKPFFFIPEHIMQKMPERFLATRAKVVANVKRLCDMEEAILEQYRAKGYAEVEVEVEDYEGEGN